MFKYLPSLHYLNTMIPLEMFHLLWLSTGANLRIILTNLGHANRQDNTLSAFGRTSFLIALSKIIPAHVRELENEFITLRGTRGFKLIYLETHLTLLYEGRDWKTLIEVFALTLFGILLFPKVENFVDETAIWAFMAFKNHSKNLVTAILADTYIALDCVIQKIIRSCWPSICLFCLSG